MHACGHGFAGSGGECEPQYFFRDILVSQGDDFGWQALFGKGSGEMGSGVMGGEEAARIVAQEGVVGGKGVEGEQNGGRVWWVWLAGREVLGGAEEGEVGGGRADSVVRVGRGDGAERGKESGGGERAGCRVTRQFREGGERLVVVTVPGEHGEEFRKGAGHSPVVPCLSEEADGVVGSVELLFEDGSCEDGVGFFAEAGVFVEFAGFLVAAGLVEEVSGWQGISCGEP